jgi:hypothetical protein
LLAPGKAARFVISQRKLQNHSADAAKIITEAQGQSRLLAEGELYT